MDDKKNFIMSVVGNPCEKVMQTTWGNRKIPIRRMLRIDEYVDLIRKIIDNCRTDDESIGLELVDFSIRINIISAFTGLDLPDDVNDMFSLAYGSNLYDVVCAHASQKQIEAIRETVMLYVK